MFQRKRKLDAQGGFPCKKLFPEDKTVSSKCTSTVSSDKGTCAMQSASTQTGQTSCYVSSSGDKPKQSRSVIPTKDNPPPGMNEWLSEFQVIQGKVFLILKFLK